MPILKPCPGCGTLTPRAYCPRCAERKGYPPGGGVTKTTPPSRQARHVQAPAKTTPRNGSTRGWRKLRGEILARDGHRCTHVDPVGRRCRATVNLHVDHVVPVARGGTDDPANLRTLCARHNLAKGARMPRQG